MKKLALSGAVLLLAAISACSSGPDMKEGKWKITTEVSMTGIPMKMPVMSHEQCLTKDQMIPKNGQQAKQSCSVVNQKISGNTVTWNVICKDNGSESKSDGSITYKGTAFSGTINMTMTGGPMTVTATNTITGEYLGPCK